MTAKYDRHELIGSGTFGNVFLVRSKASGQQYVLKEINLRNMSVSEKHLALTEVTVLARCRHKNIIRYKEAMIEQENGILSIVMEYAEHGDMYAAIKRRKGVYFPETDVLSWFLQITLALQYIHNHNILHRDLKTQNIFLTGNKMVKIGDFGIARVLKEDHELATTAIGTPYYLSPEICQRKPYNCKSDVWALGCILFEISALVHPFQGQNFHQLVTSILKAQHKQLPSHCSILVQDLVKILLHLDPEKRPSTDEILAIPALQPHLYRYLNNFSTPESLSIIDTIAVASLKKSNNARRFSSNDILDASRPITMKRTSSVSSVGKSITKVQRPCISSGADESPKSPKPLSSFHRQLKKGSAPCHPSPLADIKNQKSRTKKCISVCKELPVSQLPLKDCGGLKKTYSILKKAVVKGEKAIGMIGNKIFKDTNAADQRPEAGTDTDGGYQSCETPGQTITEPSSIGKEQKKPWSMPSMYSQKQSKISEKSNGDLHAGATAEYVDDVFDVEAKEDTVVVHCPHSSQCQHCILDVLWKNRIKSTGFVNDVERHRLTRTLQRVLGKEEFDKIYHALHKGWNDESANCDFTLHSVVQQLNFEQRQYIPLLVQLLQMDFVIKIPFVRQ